MCPAPRPPPPPDRAFATRTPTQLRRAILNRSSMPYPTVSSDISIELGLPDSGRVGRISCVTASFVAVPEAAMYEDRRLELRQDQVGSSRHPFGLQPVAKSARMQCLSEHELGSGVLSPDPGHHPRSCRLVHDVWHVLGFTTPRQPRMTARRCHSDRNASANSNRRSFSGPGGLGEGFASLRERVDRLFEFASRRKGTKRPSHLRLRAFLRKFDDWPKNTTIGWPRRNRTALVALFPAQWAAADDEARCMELENPRRRFSLCRIAAIKSESGGQTVLIGGPPCQAYSLVGRSRNAATPNMTRRRISATSCTTNMSGFCIG